MFDKTGTLTVGKPVVVNTRLLKQMIPQEFYELVAATEVCKFQETGLILVRVMSYEYFSCCVLVLGEQ